MTRDTEQDRHDVVVIGAGTGGLVAGGLLAKAGRSVLVLEAEDTPGGFARSFESEGCSFDLADHVIMSCAPAGRFGDGLLHQILASLGVADRVSFAALDPFYAAYCGGERFVLPGGWEPHIDALCGYFPAEAQGIRDLFAVYDRTYRQAVGLPVSVRLLDLPKLPFRFDELFRERNHSMADLFSRHIKDPLLRTVHTALWPYLGLGPSRASAVAWASMMGSYVGEGAFYPLGGYQRLSDALAEGLRRHGGELRCGQPVTAIRCSGGRVTGVRTAGGADIDASIVIAAMDPRAAVGPMLQGDAVPARYRRRLAGGELAISVLALYLAVNLDLDRSRVAHETAVMDGDSDEVLARGLAGDVQMVLMTTPTLTEPQRSQTGRHTVVLKTTCPAEGVRYDEAQIAERMIDLASQAVPGLRDGISGVDGRTVDRPWPLRRLGPIYGWAMSPQQMALNRLPHRTPIEGLFLAGHWAQPCAGVWGAAASAVQLARVLLERAPGSGLVPLQI